MCSNKKYQSTSLSEHRKRYCKGTLEYILRKYFDSLPNIASAH